MTQLQVHKRIDEFLEAEIITSSVEIARELISYNDDARRYFFSKANEAWLKWVFENGLFADLKKPSGDQNKYSYRLPELDYLVRMAEKDPKMVAEIIGSVAISKETFNPEVVDRFFWITGLLPVDQIKILLPKMLRENWVQLMVNFSKSGYEYKKMVEKLKDAKAYNDLIELAKIILAVRTRGELDAIDEFSVSSKLFYLHDITESGIFEALIDDDNNEKEGSLMVILEILSNIVTLGKDREESAFTETEPFYLLDVDLFTDEIKTSRRSYSKDDIENLILVTRDLIRALFSVACDNPVEARRLYTTYIATLPDSRTLYKLKLFAITCCPDIFRKEIKESLFRVFNVGERYFDIEGGAEYHHAIIFGFASLDMETKHEYVEKVFEYFGADLGAENKDKENWRKEAGREILMYIKKELTEAEIIKTEALLGKFPDGDAPAPHPVSSGIVSGSLTHKSPFNLTDYSVPEIIEHLKTDWSPKDLNEKFKNDDFLNPRGAEGLGEALKDDIKIRIDDYFTNLHGFFDRESMHPNYVYSLLRGVEEMLRDKKTLNGKQCDLLVGFFGVIRKSGELKEFEKSDEKSWLGDWITVHKIMADILIEVLVDIKDSEVFTRNREDILVIIKYLLTIKSSPSDEDNKQESDEPAHVAINSVRGQAFRAFVQFTYSEGSKSLSDDVKVLYEHMLDTDSSAAVRFTIGQFLASFYFRDVEFIVSLLPKIFPKTEIGKEKLYFATWEGYLASSLYKEIFEELHDYYKYAISIKPDNYPNRKYSKNLDESLAVHLALAYTHLDLNIGDPLFELFWNTPNEERHYEFVSFIGRSCLTRDQAGEKWFEENGVSKDKLLKFWDWIISSDIFIEPKAFSGFGFWINQDKAVIDEKTIVKNLSISLKKSEGDIDWEYGLTHRLITFAGIDPVNTLEIITNYLLLNGELSPHRRSPMFSLDHEIKEALIIIYKEPTLKKAVEDLVNTLIEKGSSSFWGLKEILD